MLNKSQKGAKIAFEMLTGNHHYVRDCFKEEWPEPRWIPDLKIAENKSSVEFVGSCGITASTGMWVIEIIKRISDITYDEIPIKKLRKIKFDTAMPDDHKHMVFFSVVFTDNTELMVGGCTDFSGEGGRGNQEMTEFLEFLAELYNIYVDVEHYAFPIWEETENRLIEVETANEGLLSEL